MEHPEIDDAPERDNNVQPDDADDGDSNSMTHPSKTTTIAPPPTGGFGPIFTNPIQQNKLNAKPSGNFIKLRCLAKGDPEPSIEWTKDGEKIERKMGQVQYNKWAITMEDLIPDDSGAYTCKVCNIHNCINYTSKLEVSGNKIYLTFFSLSQFKIISLNNAIDSCRSISIGTNHI